MTRDYSAFKEGCKLYGYLEVNRVSGSFHIAPGKSYAINHVHGEFLFFNCQIEELKLKSITLTFTVHDVQPYSSEDFNVTHQINSLSFGTSLIGKENPLDGFLTTADKGKTN